MAQLLIEGADQFFNTQDGVKICYRCYGEGVPLLLIAGLGLQLHYWSPVLVNGLTAQGFQVIVFDNRDIGLSDRIKGKPPTVLQQATAKTQGNAYDLGHMAQDVVDLLNHLALGKAHVVGMSMGGMIAQTVAARHPSRVLSLISIFSNTGEKGVGKTALSTMLKLLSPPAKNEKGFIKNYISMNKHIGSTAYDMDENTQTLYAKQAWQRGGGVKIAPGVARQIGAILKSGNRTAELQKINIPTLVIHADQDLIVDVSGGYATAKAIADAKLILISGMGHFISHQVAPYLVDLIAGHSKRIAA